MMVNGASHCASKAKSVDCSRRRLMLRWHRRYFAFISRTGPDYFGMTDIFHSRWLPFLMLTCSNVFMTFAWYAHLRNLASKPWYVAASVSWGIALFEYLLQVPANRIGYTQLSLAQLKILQEVITLGVFVPFAVFYMRQPLKWDYLWAALCILGAVYFMFRSGAPAGH